MSTLIIPQATTIRTSADESVPNLNCINVAVGRHLTGLLLQRGATKRGTARRAGIAATTFRRCLTGERPIFVSELMRVSQALSVEIGSLLPAKAELDAAIDQQRAEVTRRMGGYDA